MVETIRLSGAGLALSTVPSDALGQTGSGDIGGMLVAVVALVGLGLAVVALWHGGFSDLLGRLGGGATDGTHRAGVDSTTAPAESESTRESRTDQDLESPQPAREDLSDREVVLGILDENDGRLKQARIVEATDWSKSKVSMVLSEMEDEGDITKLRVGRENIISVEGSEPEAAGSPFDDE